MPLPDEKSELDDIGHPKRASLPVPVSEQSEMRSDELHDLWAELGLLEDERDPEQRDGETEQGG